MPQQLVFDCICLDHNSQSGGNSRAHFLSAPGIYEPELRTLEWNRGTLAWNKIRRSESHRLQTSHDVGGRALRTRAEPARPSPDAGGRGPRSQSDGGGRPAPAPPLPLVAVPPSPANPNTPGAGARDLPVVARRRDAAAGRRRPRGLRAASLYGVAAHQPQAPGAARRARSGEWPPVAELARGCLAGLGHRGHGPGKGRLSGKGHLPPLPRHCPAPPGLRNPPSAVPGSSLNC